ncbi:ABC transporter permease, partial [Candidatus Woesebacteria bacterium]|nr:ABC transporter permease [Candidatus Woesebacteria bacterium]
YNPSFETLSGIDYFGNEYEPWIQDDFLLWKKESCNQSDYNCVDGEYVRLVEGGVQFVRSGYVTEQDVTLERFHIEYSIGPSLAEGEVISEVQFGFPTAEYVPIYSSPEEGKADLQLTTMGDIETDYIKGTLVFGGVYASQDTWGRAAKNEHGTEMGLWIRAKVPLWRKVDCGDCDEMYLRELDTYENQVEAFAFIKASEVAIEELEQPPVFGSVLGEATTSAEVSEANVLETTVAEGDIEENPGEIVLDDGTVISLSETEDGQIEWVSIASNSAGLSSEKNELPKISFPEGTQKVVLVNRALLSVLGLSEAEAIGKTFRASLVLDSEFFEDGESRSETEYTDLTIIGVIPEEKTPAFYMPFTDIRSLGIQNYSQLKVVTKNQGALKDVRKAIEGLGFRTASVVDTVSRINSLFDTIRILLTTLGLIALSIAALGMFNTLTVSLLEKTREVGLMKTIGMKSNEVKRLFLAESIIMGLSGGFFGLFLGAFAGYALSFFLSTIAVANGLGTINLVYIPFSLVIGILGLSFVVGILTGLYPSKRATTISALNALRYE